VVKSIKWKQEQLFKESAKGGAGSLRKINKMDKPLARLTKGHMESILINKSEMKRETTTDPEEIQNTIRSFYKAYTQQNWKIWTKQNINYHIPRSNF
jgi:hypothetical protein